MGKYLAIFKITQDVESKETDSYDEAMTWLNEQNKHRKFITPISIVDMSTKEIVWYSYFLGIDISFYHTQKFINHL